MLIIFIKKMMSFFFLIFGLGILWLVDGSEIMFMDSKFEFELLFAILIKVWTVRLYSNISNKVL